MDLFCVEVFAQHGGTLLQNGAICILKTQVNLALPVHSRGLSFREHAVVWTQFKVFLVLHLDVLLATQGLRCHEFSWRLHGTLLIELVFSGESILDAHGLESGEAAIVVSAHRFFSRHWLAQYGARVFYLSFSIGLLRRL